MLKVLWSRLLRRHLDVMVLRLEALREQLLIRCRRHRSRVGLLVALLLPLLGAISAEVVLRVGVRQTCDRP